MCVRKLDLRMLITIRNSNSSTEVNSSEVSLKLQSEFCVCTQKDSDHFHWEAEAYLTYRLVRIMPLYYAHTCGSQEYAF